MLVWFVVLARWRRSTGSRSTPASSGALSPTYARARSSSTTALTAFLALGGVVLAVTGAEALYADMGHFGAQPDPARVAARRLPGADAELPRPGRADPRATRAAIANPFYLLVPALGADPDGRAGDVSRR